MKELILTKWHMNALMNELKLLYDSQYAIMPLLNNVGVKICTQWTQRTATFSFVSDSRVKVSLSPSFSSVDRHVLTTAIMRVFKWEPIKFRPWCCGLFRWNQANELHFAL